LNQYEEEKMNWIIELLMPFWLWIANIMPNTIFALDINIFVALALNSCIIAPFFLIHHGTFHDKCEEFHGTYFHIIFGLGGTVGLMIFAFVAMVFQSGFLSICLLAIVLLMIAWSYQRYKMACSIASSA